MEKNLKKPQKTNLPSKFLYRCWVPFFSFERPQPLLIIVVTGAFSRTKRNSFRLRGVTSFYTLTICHSLWLLSPTAMLLLVFVVVFNFVPLSPIFRQTRLRRSNDFVGPTYVQGIRSPSVRTFNANVAWWWQRLIWQKIRHTFTFLPPM